MPVDSSIALAGKPPVLPEVDFNKTFLTLGQLKYLNAEAARTAAQTGLVETQGQAARADLAASNRLRAVDPTGGGQTLTSLRTGAVPTGGPPFDEATLAALPQGGQTPAPGAPAGPPPAGSPPPGATPAPQRLATADLARAYITADPVKGVEIATKLFEHDKMTLEAQKTQLDLGGSRLAMASAAYNGVTDQASLELANQFVQHVTGLPPDHLLQTYSKDGVEQVRNLQRTAQQHLDQANKVVEQKQNALKLQTEDFRAQTERQTEDRTGRKFLYPTTPTGILPLPEYPQRGQEPMGGGAASGTPQAIPGTAPAMPGGAAEAAGYEQRARAAHTLTVQLEDKGVNVAGGVQKAVSSVPVVGNYFTPTEVQQYNQAKSDFITAISRGESPRMSPQQLALYDEQYFPQPGDDHATIQQKRTSRESALQELRIQTNRPEGLTPPGQTQMPGTPPGAGSAPAAPTPSTIQWTPDQQAELKQRFIWAGSTPADAARQVQGIVNATPPAAPAAPEKPSATTKEVWSQKEFRAWLQKPALQGKFTPQVGLEFLRGKGIEVTP